MAEDQNCFCYFTAAIASSTFCEHKEFQRSATHVTADLPPYFAHS
jgi:hypothetical protein